jgi:hypothetical protein
VDRMTASPWLMGAGPGPEHPAFWRMIPTW